MLMKSALFRLVHSRIPVGRSGGRSDAFAAIKRDTVLESLDVLGGLAREHGFEVLVVWFPRLRGRERAEHGSQQIRIRTASDANGFHWLDLSPTLRACAEGGPIAADSIHPDRRGHRCVGEAIARRVGSEIARGRGASATRESTRARRRRG
jgi:hypothetical protein